MQTASLIWPLQTTPCTPLEQPVIISIGKEWTIIDFVHNTFIISYYVASNINSILRRYEKGISVEEFFLNNARKEKVHIKICKKFLQNLSISTLSHTFTKKKCWFLFRRHISSTSDYLPLYLVKQ